MLFLLAGVRQVTVMVGPWGPLFTNDTTVILWDGHGFFNCILFCCRLCTCVRGKKNNRTRHAEQKNKNQTNKRGKIASKTWPVGTKGETEKHFCIPPKKCLNVPHKWQRQATTTPNFASKCTDTIFLDFALHDDNYYCHREFPKFESSQQRPHSGRLRPSKTKNHPATLCCANNSITILLPPAPAAGT